MTLLLDLLDAPTGTIATTIVDGTPKTIAIIETAAGVRRLAVQGDAIVGAAQLPDRLRDGRVTAPAVKQLYPASGDLLPERTYIEDNDEAEAEWRREYDTLYALPVGAVIDATPTGSALLDVGSPGDVMLFTRVTPVGWARLKPVSPEVDAVRDVLSGDVSRFPNEYVTAWMLGFVGDCALADFTVLSDLAPWGTFSAGAAPASIPADAD